jgi:hypothetical protein
VKSLALGLALAVVAVAVAASPAVAVPWRGTALNALGYGEPASTKQLDAAQRTGANAVRIDIRWDQLQPDDSGHYDLTGYVAQLDAYLQKAADRGLKVVGVLQGTPAWGASVRAAHCGSVPATSIPPQHPADYAAAAAFVAKRWADKLAGLEIWNEMNNSTFWCADDWEGDYAALLKAAYPAVKAVALNLPVLGGALLYGHADTLDALYDLGIKGNFDGIAIHPYDDLNRPARQDAVHVFAQSVPLVHQTMVDHGDGDKPLWLTEFGWPTCPATSVSPCVSEDQQAAKLTDAFNTAAGWPYVGALIVFSLRDAQTGSSNWEYNMGLLHTDFTEKPAFAAFRRALAPPPTPAPSPVAAASATQTATSASQGSAPPGRRHVAPLPAVRRWILLRTGQLRVYLACRARERCRGIVQIVRRRGRRSIRLTVLNVSLPAGQQSVRTVRLSGAIAARAIRLLVGR